MLEANHDIRMLQVGSYPYYLKQRILGDRGHLSNENAGKLLCRLLHDDMKAVFLGHLSKENNYEALAYETVCSEVTLGDNPYRSKRFSDSGCETGQYFRCGCIVEEIIYSKETKLYLKYRFSFYIQIRENLKLYFPWDSQNGQQTQIQEEYHEKNNYHSSRK